MILMNSKIGEKVRTEWKKVRLGEVGVVITGKTPSTKRHEYFSKEYPFITPTDIKENQHWVETERFLSEEGRASQKQLLLPKGAICFVCIGATIGKICITSRPSFTNQQINSIIVNENYFDRRLIYYLLCTQIENVKKIAGGAATPIVNKTAFTNIVLEVPPLPLQRKIASILSAYDGLKENNNRRIKILEEMAQAIYKEWFVNFRFPGHEKIKMVSPSPSGRGRGEGVNNMGMIPEGWEVKKLGDICTIVMGQSPKSEFYNEDGNGLPFHQGVTDFGDRFPSDRMHCTVQNRIAEAGDILFSVRAPVGRINIADKKMVIGRGLCAIRSRTGSQSFVFQQLKDKFQEPDTMGSGTIFKSVTKEDVYGIKMIVPSGKTQNNFEESAQPFFRKLEILYNKNENLRKTCDLLLPKLISGEVEVEKNDA